MPMLPTVSAGSCFSDPFGDTDIAWTSTSTKNIETYWDQTLIQISQISPKLKSFNCEKGWFSANTFEITIQHPYQYFIKISQNHMNHMVLAPKMAPGLLLFPLPVAKSHPSTPTQRDPVDYFWVPWRPCARGGRCCERWGGPDGARTGPRWSEAGLVTGGLPASGNSSLVAMPHCLKMLRMSVGLETKSTPEHLKNRHRHQTTNKTMKTIYAMSNDLYKIP